eukprot:scaffold2033_cov367-Prasinococcus_capsulatus_cf.AAC.16
MSCAASRRCCCCRRCRRGSAGSPGKGFGLAAPAAARSGVGLRLRTGAHIPGCKWGRGRHESVRVFGGARGQPPPRRGPRRSPRPAPAEP